MANTAPIFSKEPDVQWCKPALTANTATDGTGTTALLFSADATNGGYLDYIQIKPLGNTGSSTTLRLFLNNGSDPAVAANNSLFDEVTLAAITLSNSAQNPRLISPQRIPLPAGYRVYCCFGITVTNGWQITAVGGKY